MYVTPQRKTFARKGKIKSELEAENSFREFYREKKWKRELGSMIFFLVSGLCLPFLLS